MSQALYRKYRSKTLAEVVGQPHITNTLDQSLKTGRISHAYLFTGPRGVGKTSIARILAHEINGLPYTDESTHLDIIEIDAASNRRIDEIRDLRDRIHIAPSSAKYKVYIIDEVHMLTKEAFNALLKTLEEPPAHVVFILATTEAHKLPETIISRTQRYHFKTIDRDDVVTHLKSIAKSEGIKIDDEALGMIADHGQGSFRDSISLLDQVASGNDQKITASQIQQATGLAPKSLVDAIVQAISASNPSDVMTQLEKARADGISAKPLAQQLIAELRSSYQNNPQQQSLIMMQELLDIESRNQPDIALELTLLRFATPADTPPAAQPVVPTPQPAPAAPTPTPTPAPQPAPKPKAAPTPKPEPKAEEVPVEQVVIEETLPSNGDSKPFSPESWIQVLSALKSTNPSLYSVLRMAEARDADGKLELHFKHAFHAKRLKESRNQQPIIAILQQVFGRALPIDTVHSPNAQPLNAPIPTTAHAKAPSIEADQEPDADLAAVMDAFGGGEVVDL